MSLRTLAENDLAIMMEDANCSFGWSVVLTDPSGFASVEPLTALTQDIAVDIDPDTGVAVSGRTASATFRISTLTTAGYTGLPVGIADGALKPWVVTFNDINGASFTYKVAESLPDRTVGVVVTLLELYEGA